MKRAANHSAVNELMLGKLHGVLHWLRTFAGTRRARQLVLGLFVVQALVLVFVVHIGTPPDEINHIKFIEYYAQHSLSPIFTQQQPTYNLGDKTREVDYLYHYAMSFVYRLTPLSNEGKYFVIRMCSVVFGVITFLLLAHILSRIGMSDAVITVALAILTNLPMVLMMSSAINNDVVVWLGMLSGIYLLMQLWQRPNIIDLLWLVVLCLAGGLVKRTLIPLGLLFAILGFIVILRKGHIIAAQLRKFNVRIAILIVLCIISAGLFSERVIGNVIRYHTITPSCDQVYDSPVPCAVFWADIRSNMLATQPREPALAPATFALAWFYSSLVNVVDIQTQGWGHIVAPVWWLIPLLTCLFLIGIGYGGYYEWRQRKDTFDTLARYRVAVLLIAIYFMIVHMIVNYDSYRDIGFFGLALNGRYIIPSLLPLVGFACFYWARLLNKHPQVLTALAVTIILSTVGGSGLIMMLRNSQLYLGGYQ